MHIAASLNSSLLNPAELRSLQLQNLKLATVENTDLGKKKKKKSRALVAHAFNPSTQEAEAAGFLSSRPAWSTK
jgi:hypothetical protein